MTPYTATSSVYAPATTVHLTRRHGDLRRGTLGRIIGRFARDEPTYLVNFGDEGVIEVSDDEIVTAEADADADRALHRSNSKTERHEA